MAASPLRIPLLRDWHSHPFLYAAFHASGLDLNRDPTETRDQAVARIRDHARRGPPGWTIAFSWNSGRYPLAKDLFDDLPPVVVLNLSLHGLVVNDAGRAALGRDDPEVAARLDDQHWLERNLRRVLNLFATSGASADRLREFFRWLLTEHGIWHAEELLLVGEHELRLFAEAGLTDRTRFWAGPDQYERLSPALRERVYGIKLFTDGALGAWTAALHQPYRGTSQSGMLLYERGELEGVLSRYLSAGKPMALHAIGNRAIDQTVAAIEAVGVPGGVEVRVEHAQFISEPTARRAKALGVRLCMQPNFSDDSACYADRLPDGYPGRNNPFRMLIDRVGYAPGRDLLFGSDGMPHGFREGLRQALFPPFPGQVLTVDEFVAGYCLPDERAGHIEVSVDRNGRRVTGRVVLADGR